MFVLMDGFVKILTAILGWGSFVYAGVLGVALLLGRKCRLLAGCCMAYVAGFLVFRFCFPAAFFRWIPGIAIFLTVGSTIWSNYADKKNEKRWWNR